MWTVVHTKPCWSHLLSSTARLDTFNVNNNAVTRGEVSLEYDVDGGPYQVLLKPPAVIYGTTRHIQCQQQRGYRRRSSGGSSSGSGTIATCKSSSSYRSILFDVLDCTIKSWFSGGWWCWWCDGDLWWMCLDTLVSHVVTVRMHDTHFHLLHSIIGNWILWITRKGKSKENICGEKSSTVTATT